jgi:hypothetical protein
LKASTFAAVVVSCGNKEGLERTLHSLLHEQTQRPDEILLYAAGYGPAYSMKLDEQFPGVRLFTPPPRGDWGHHDRADALGFVNSEWMGYFNDDDLYERDYIKIMMAAAWPAVCDVVHCHFDHVDNSGRLHAEIFGQHFHAIHGACIKGSNVGNFIIRTEVARSVGYPSDQVYENDGIFIDRVRDSGARVVGIPQLLFHHNGQRRLQNSH